MPGKRILSDDQLDRMAEMRERGLSYAQIAAQFTSEGTAIKPVTIRWQCLRLGAFPPGKTHPNVGVPCSPRGRPFTPEEDALLLEMDRAGYRRAEIARTLKRKHNSVVGRFYTLARIDAQATF